MRQYTQLDRACPGEVAAERRTGGDGSTRHSRLTLGPLEVIDVVRVRRGILGRGRGGGAASGGADDGGGCGGGGCADYRDGCSAGSGYGSSGSSTGCGTCGDGGSGTTGGRDNARGHDEEAGCGDGGVTVHGEVGGPLGLATLQSGRDGGGSGRGDSSTMRSVQVCYVCGRIDLMRVVLKVVVVVDVLTI